MSIRFLCTHCQKPLEVDDPEAGKEVLCYYCRKPVQVPSQSDAALGTTSVPPPPRPASTLGVIGAVAGLGMVAGFLFLVIWGFNQLVALTHTTEFGAASPEMREKMRDQKLAEVRKHPVFTRGPWVIFGLATLAAAFSIAGLIRNSGRGPAVIGLVLGGGYLIIQIALLLRAMLIAHKSGG